ncbi:MAG TPA: hypothetical protein VFX86_04225 [Candidatus Saccharimonadales bacterium]|nr:hypothetical protein [Candidatus Saccharimonadales bacterium]
MMRIDSVEAMRAIRPLEDDSWLAGFEQRAQELFGPEALDFDDPVLENHGVILIDPAEVAEVRAITNGLLGHLSSKQLVKHAWHELDASFAEPIDDARFGSELMVRDANVVDAPSKQVLIAKINPDKSLKRERFGLLRAVEKTARSSGLDLPWRGAGPYNRVWMRLAVLTEESYYIPFDHRMLELAKHLPDEVRVGPGRIEPATGQVSRLVR